MGGTLADRGGHNILEPALFGLPIVAGPHLENFAEIEKLFTAVEAFVRIARPADLAPVTDRLLRDPVVRHEIGERARRTAEAQRGATSKAVATILEQRWRSLPNSVPYGPLKPVMALLAWAWTRGVRWKLNRAAKRPRALST